MRSFGFGQSAFNDFIDLQSIAGPLGLLPRAGLPRLSDLTKQASDVSSSSSSLWVQRRVLSSHVLRTPFRRPCSPCPFGFVPRRMPCFLTNQALSPDRAGAWAFPEQDAAAVQLGSAQAHPAAGQVCCSRRPDSRSDLPDAATEAFFAGALRLVRRSGRGAASPAAGLDDLQQLRHPGVTRGIHAC